MKRDIKKRVLYISPLPPPAGGIATWTKKIFDNGLPNGFEPQIINTCILGNRDNFEKVKLKFFFIELIRNSKIVFSLLQHLLLNKPYIIHLNCSLSSIGIFRDLCCALLSRIFSIPIVTHYRGNITDFSQSKFHGLCFIALKKLVRISNVNISLNKPSLKFSIDLNKNNSNVCLLLPNFIDDFFFKNEIIKEHKFMVRNIVTFVGGVTKSKGCSEILEVARRLPNVDFRIIGVILDDMKEELQALPSNVILYGAMEHSKVIKELYESDIFLFPSHTEGFPNAVLEAMSIGLVVVATNVGAIPEMVDENKGGFIVKCGDIDGLESSINNLVNDPERKYAMGEYNRRKSQTYYTYSAIINELVRIYETTVERARIKSL